MRLSQKQTAPFYSPTFGRFSCLFWDRALIFCPLPAISSHFGLSQKKNVDFWDSPVLLEAASLRFDVDVVLEYLFPGREIVGPVIQRCFESHGCDRLVLTASPIRDGSYVVSALLSVL
jgi:hypothetical protein